MFQHLFFEPSFADGIKQMKHWFRLVCFVLSCLCVVSVCVVCLFRFVLFICFISFFFGVG